MLNPEELYLIKNSFIDASINAGKSIIEIKKRGFRTKSKSSGSSLASQIVTEADFASQKIILDSLNPIISQFNFGLLAEEAPDDNSRLIKDYFVAIDPLDGTKSFTESNSGYSISIALVCRTGESIVGVVFDPENNLIYWAIKGEGLYRNNHKWIPDTVTKISNSVCVCDPGNKIIQKYKSHTIYVGGAVMSAIAVLEGRADCYYKQPKRELGGGCIWDYASVVLFFKEAGALASGYKGESIMLNSPQTVYMNKSGSYFSRNIKLKDFIS